MYSADRANNTVLLRMKNYQDAARKSIEAGAAKYHAQPVARPNGAFRQPLTHYPARLIAKSDMYP